MLVNHFARSCILPRAKHARLKTTKIVSEFHRRITKYYNMFSRKSKISRRKSLRRGGKGFFLLTVLLVSVIGFLCFKIFHRKNHLHVSVMFKDYDTSMKSSQNTEEDYSVVIHQNPKPIETSSILLAVTSSAPTTKRPPNKAGNAWFQNPVYKCRNNPPFLLVLISSQADNKEQRAVVRDTWCKNTVYQKGRSVQCIFMIGRDINDDEITSSILSESTEHRDLIVKDFDDDFRNSSKKLMMGLKWAEDFCSQASFVMKIEDDVIVNLKFVLNDLLSEAAHEKTAVGRCWADSPNRNPESKYYVSLEMFPEEKFPMYCSTSGFIMSADVVRAMNHVHSINPRENFPLDDVYAGLLWQDIGLQPVNHDEFIIGRYDTSMICEYAKSAAIVHVHNHSPVKTWNTMSECADQ